MAETCTVSAPAGTRSRKRPSPSVSAVAPPSTTARRAPASGSRVPRVRTVPVISATGASAPASAAWATKKYE